jgi:hypothetical protein
MTEVMVSIGIWAFGLLIFTLLAKAALPVQCEFLRRQRAREQENWDGFERRHNV